MMAAVALGPMLIGVPDIVMAGPAGDTVCPAVTKLEEASAVYNAPPNDTRPKYDVIAGVFATVVSGMVIPVLTIAMAEGARE